MTNAFGITMKMIFFCPQCCVYGLQPSLLKTSDTFWSTKFEMPLNKMRPLYCMESRKVNLCQYLPSCSLVCSLSTLLSPFMPFHPSPVFSDIHPPHPDSQFFFPLSGFSLGWSHSTTDQVVQLCVNSARNVCISQELSWHGNLIE